MQHLLLVLNNAPWDFPGKTRRDQKIAWLDHIVRNCKVKLPEKSLLEIELLKCLIE